MMTKMMTSDESKCAACVAMKAANVKTLDDAFTIGLAVGVGLEHTGMTPTFCVKHRALLQKMADKVDSETITQH